LRAWVLINQARGPREIAFFRVGLRTSTLLDFAHA
jgi:hypothetical protein